ncbi:MAG: tRNA preQ1(34) S-adenosylmethionine ribosyltransferase-isomerase QueA [Deltaproteobacteria bacterium GWA2_55_10]|nr:MAG: tRNA preQ1(34) S-adenosylmethionine ribosyltransferase-isomerase QueA [Deltaproteobacteria bacterium GWA2_55_10]
MELKDFEFDLPERLIAQRPLPERDSSRLMAVSRETGNIEHRSFRDLPGFLRAGDVLVLNDTKVIPTRLFGAKTTGGKVELLLVERINGNEWQCLSKPSLKPGGRILFEGLEGEVTGRDEDGLCTIRFSGPLDLEKTGKVPLPPYIRREADEADKIRYQTVFAGPVGAVAAPTAGLHFTDSILDEIRAMGVLVRHVTLHTGPGTFMPVRTNRVEEHRMMKERYSIPKETFDAVDSAKKEGRRVVAVGTTSTRTLEASLSKGFDEPLLEGATGLFIYPGYKFRVVDALLTNFHLPGSTLLMLVSAFAGRELILKAYADAVQEEYRFFSYGDAMLLF